MSIGSASLQGQYYDGDQPISVAATLLFSNQDVALICTQVSDSFRARQLRVSPRVGRANRFIALPNGGQFQCADDALLDRLPQDEKSEGPVAWLEARLPVAIASIAIIISLVLGGYFYGMPAAAKRIVAHIPIETEQALGKQILSWLDDNNWFKVSKIGETVQSMIREDFEGLYNGLPMESHYRLEFRSSFVGPNAFALPGGTIVITDAMVDLAETLDEIGAVLAHEIGHIEHRHTMRHLLQDSATAIVATAITADAASLSVAVAGLPALLARARYSREFESEADDFAFQLLKQRGRSPESFATLMERLAGDENDTDSSLAFLSTHPITAERVQRARAAAKQ